MSTDSISPPLEDRAPFGLRRAISATNNFAEFRTLDPESAGRIITRGSIGQHNLIQVDRNLSLDPTLGHGETLMKHHRVRIISIAALILALNFPVSEPAALPSPKPQPAASTAAAAIRHQEIHDAITSLRIARDYLQHASHNFGGHRETAILKIDESLTQLQMCLDYDK